MAQILLIDENEFRRRFLAETLVAAGYEVRAADDGPRGLRMFRERPADVIVIDLEMPETDGLETLRRLRLLNPFAGFVGLTDLFLEDADYLGVAIALPGNCMTDQLTEAVEKALERTLAEL